MRAGGARSQCFAQGRREVRAGCVRAQGTVVQDQTDGMTCVPFATSAVRARGARSQCFAQGRREVRAGCVRSQGRRHCGCRDHNAITRF